MTNPESSPDNPLVEDGGMVVVNASLEVMACNRQAERMLGVELPPGSRLDPSARLEKRSGHRLEEALRDTLERGVEKKRLPLNIVRERGKLEKCRCSLQPLVSGNGRVIGAVLRLNPIFQTPPVDPDDFEPSAGLTSSEVIPSLIESLPEGVFTINMRWRIASFNRMAEQITGFRREEVIGRNCWDVFRSDLCKEGCPLRNALETGDSCIDQDVRILGKRGGRQTLLVNTGVLRDSRGQLAGAIETFRPLTGEIRIPHHFPEAYTFASIVGKSPAMRRLFEILPDIAASDTNVLINGESGTGKDLFARTIHQHSSRRDFPFVAVNCSALAESLLESELFGHEKAAFTGAVQTRQGRFEMAKNGTLFLDEIGDLKPQLQVKLLRVLEERVFERVGGTRPIRMNARVISATNCDLKTALKQGTFREDFYYRLRTVPITIPPLRERREDIPLLVEYFIQCLNRRTQKQVQSVDPKVMQFFMKYNWPGNVRELERTIEYAFVFVRGSVILPRNLPDAGEFGSAPPSRGEGKPPHTDTNSRESIIWALSRTDGRRKEAAELLGISRTSLWRRMKAFDLA